MPAGFDNVHSFDPHSIGDLSGKVALVTGGNSGIGLETVKQLAPTNATIILTSRSAERATNAIAEIKKSIPKANLSFIQMDLSSLHSVQTAVRSFVKSYDRLDILIMNAGVMDVPPAVTEDGYEVQFGTNFMGHALLVNLLLPTITRTAELPGSDVRVVTVTSEGHRITSSIGFEAVRTSMHSYIPGYSFIRYGQSKFAQLLYAIQLARKYPAITSVAVHPGVVRTDMFNKMKWGVRTFLETMNRMIGVDFLDPTSGAYSLVWAAVAPETQLESGSYYLPVGVEGKLDKKIEEGNVGSQLWDWTQTELADWEL